MIVLLTLSTVTMLAGAQASTQDRGLAQARGYWVDPSTGLMWASKDNGRDVNWHKAMKYCSNLRLAGYSDWRLATIDELAGLTDKNVYAPKEVGSVDYFPLSAALHVKGNLTLTATREWSSSQRSDERGHPSEYAWFFDFVNTRRLYDETSFHDGKRALCVRRSGQ